MKNNQENNRDKSTNESGQSTDAVNKAENEDLSSENLVDALSGEYSPEEESGSSDEEAGIDLNDEFDEEEFDSENLNEDQLSEMDNSGPVENNNLGFDDSSENDASLFAKARASALEEDAEPNQEKSSSQDRSNVSKNEDPLASSPGLRVPLDKQNLEEPQSKNFDIPEITDAISKVAANKGSSIALMVIAGLVIAYIAYKSFSSSDEEKSDKNKSEVTSFQKTQVPPAAIDQSLLEPQIKALPEAPQLVVPSAPPAPIPPVVPTLEEQVPKIETPTIPAPPAAPQPAPAIAAPPIPSAPDPAAPAGGLSAEQKLARIKSSMSAGGGSGSDSDSDKGKSGSKEKKTNPELIDSGGGDVYDSIPITSNRVKATRLGDLNYIVAQGKLIDAVLETAINTDLPGMVRGIVTMDVYSEVGLNVLIPRGSRLIGTYESKVTTGMQRVEIAWKRVIRPDGIDIAIDSSGTDSLGRAGVEGEVDNKYFQMYASAIMSSILDIGLAKLQDRAAKKDGSSQSQSTTVTVPTSVSGSANSTTGTGSASVTGTTQVAAPQPYAVSTGTQPTAVTAAINSAAQQLGALSKEIIQDQYKNTKPTITIDQGTMVKVFVAKDLVFPKLGNTNGVQIMK